MVEPSNTIRYLSTFVLAVRVLCLVKNIERPFPCTINQHFVCARANPADLSVGGEQPERRGELVHSVAVTVP